MEQKTKNVLLLVPTLKLGGQERVAAKTAGIIKDACNVTMAVFDSKDAAYEPAIEVLDLQCPVVSGVLPKAWNVLRRVLVLRKLKKERGVDVTYSFGRSVNLVNVLSRNHGKIVIRLSSYGQLENSFRSKMLYRLCDRMVCCSQKLYADMVKRYPQFRKKTFCLQNPYDEKELLRLGTESVDDFAFGSNVVVSHGRLDEAKNYPRLIKAFSLVRQEVSDAQLLLIGEGAMRPQLEKLISDYGLSECVTLAGFRKNPFAYLSKATVYVMSSYVEGFPNALAEAMHFLPVIAADCKSGPREILSEGDLDRVCTEIEEADYGILVPPAAKREWNPELLDDDRILAEAILCLLQDSEKRCNMQECARKRARQFGYDSYRQRFLEIIEN